MHVSKPRSSTFQTRIRAGGGALDAYAELFGKLERRLFAAWAGGAGIASLKKGYLSEHRIPARMFNALRVSVEGKVAGVRESMRLRSLSLSRRIARAEDVLAKLRMRGDGFQVHQKRRRLGALRSRLAAVEGDLRDGRARLCFGSKRLWRKQCALAVNGYADHSEWQADWRSTRSDEFFVLGSRDETAGCQLCVATVADDLSLTLRLRLPDALEAEYGKHLVIEGVRFAYGHAAVLAALDCNRRGEPGQALSYRFKRDRKGWRVFVTTQMPVVEVVTERSRGAVWVDVNADYLAVAECDRSGNPVSSWRVPLATYGQSTKQAEALIGDAVAGIISRARAVGKPVVIEKLDFRHKKSELEALSPGHSRMLSSFSYGKVREYFHSRGYREGVEVCDVNPAFSSVIGRVKFMERYGLSVHQAAALVLARRLLGCSERIPRRWVAPVVGGGHVAFRVPARKRVKHVWSLWGSVLGQLRPALAAQHRLAGANPVRAVPRTEVRGMA